MTREELYAQALGVEATAELGDPLIATMIALQKQLSNPGSMLPHVIYAPSWAVEQLERYAAPPVIEP